MAKKLIGLAVCLMALLALWAVRRLDEARTPAAAAQGVHASDGSSAAEPSFRSTNWDPAEGVRTRRAKPASTASSKYEGMEIAVPVGEAR